MNNLLFGCYLYVLMIKQFISLTLFKVQQGEELAHIEHFLYKV